ncbi:unnamed protein product [Sphagnum balticum]
MTNKLPKIMEKQHHHYWEGIILDKSWQPGPKRRTTLKSTFGPQVLSKRITSPAYGFGTQNRHAFEKMYVSAEMAKTKPGNFSPGPAYDTLSSFGKQLTSNCESPPEIKMGTGSRWKRRKADAQPGPGAYNSDKSSFGYQVQSEKKSPEKYVFSRGTRAQADKIFLSTDFNKARYGTQSPGPMVYGARTTFGPQAASKNRTAPVINFTKGLRERRKYEDTAGPGEYKIKGSVGKQNESHKITLPSVGFTRCSRDLRQKVFLSKEHDKSHYGENSPGPAIFGQVSSMGNQANSKQMNPPFIRFTKGLRWNPPIDDIPGPGAYDV